MKSWSGITEWQLVTNKSFWASASNKFFCPVLQLSIDKGFSLIHLGIVVWISHEGLKYTVQEIVRLRGTHNSLGIFERLLQSPYDIRHLRDMKPFSGIFKVSRHSSFWQHDGLLYCHGVHAMQEQCRRHVWHFIITFNVKELRTLLCWRMKIFWRI